MQLQAIEIIKSGQGAKGPWNLAKATFNGKQYTGFVYEQVPQVGQDIEVEFYQEEYNGRMQDKFKLLGKKAQNEKIVEMAIKTHISQEIAPIKEALRAIVAHLGIQPPTPTIGNTNVPYPTGAETGADKGANFDDRTVPDINPEDIPF